MLQILWREAFTCNCTYFQYYLLFSYSYFQVDMKTMI